MTEKDVSLSIGGEPEGLEAALAQAKSIVTRAASDMERNLGTLQAAFGKIQSAMAAMTAVLAGGAAFKASIDATVDLSKQSEILGRNLGIGATEASVLKTALGDVYATEEQVTAATGKITQALNTNEAAFGRLGVKTRDSNGNFRNSLQILLDVNQRLNQLKEGTDRNVAGVQIFGRSWSTIEPLLRLNADAMESARQKAEDLGILIGQEDVEATNRYRAALNDAQDVILGLQKAIGDALLPVLTAMAKELGDNGSQAIARFRAAIMLLESSFVVLGATFEGVGLSMGAGLAQLGAIFATISDVTSRALVGDFSGAKAAWDQGWSDIHAIGQAWVEDIKKLGEDASSDMADAWERGLKPPEKTAAGPSAGGGTTEPTGGGDKGKGRLPEWQAALEERKAAWQAAQREEGSFREFSKQQELAYWQDILASERLSGQERVSIRTKVAQLALTVDKERFDAEVERLKTEESTYRSNGEAKLQIAREIAERMRAAYGDESKQYAAARRDVLTVERQIQEQLAQVRATQAESARTTALIAIDAEEEEMRERLSLRQVTEAEMLAAEVAFEERRFQIRQQAMQQRLQLATADPDRDPVQVAQLQAQIEELEAQHQARMGQLRRQELRATTADWQGAMSRVEGSFASAFSSMAKQQTGFGEGVKAMTAGVVGSFIDMIAQMAAQWILSQIAQMAGVKTTALSTITAHAGEAAAGAYAATAGIPIVGPAIAPGAAATAFSGAMGYAAVLSAARGFDIPSGLNPMTQLHQREMVLPAALADGLRDLIAGGTRGAGGMTVNISAMDASGVRRWAENPTNQRLLYGAVRTHSGRRFDQ